MRNYFVFIGLLSVLIWSCADQKREDLYDEMASDFCDCYTNNASTDTFRKYSDCIQTVLRLHRNEILPGSGDSSREYAKAANLFLKNSRLSKYCPAFRSDILQQFAKQRRLSNEKHHFTGSLISQQEIGVGTKKLYMIQLSNQNDSIFEFLSTDTINSSQVNFKRKIMVAYHIMNGKKWIDSVVTE